MKVLNGETVESQMINGETVSAMWLNGELIWQAERESQGWMHTEDWFNGDAW